MGKKWSDLVNRLTMTQIVSLPLEILGNQQRSPWLLDPTPMLEWKLSAILLLDAYAQF